jgi:uncharacterized membrane-anchored protein YitT (DUF2179 family)
MIYRNKGGRKMARQHKKETKKNIIFRFIMITFGAMLTAFAIEAFLLPNDIIDGGIIGLSLIFNETLGDFSPIFKFSIIVVLLNLPFIYSGYKQIGKTFMVSSLYGIVAMATFEELFHSIEPATNQPILATVFGGLVLGVGVGLVIRYGGSLDGTEILGIILSKKLPFSVGEFVMFINIFIFTIAGFVYGFENAMYSVMMYYIAFKVIDTVLQGLDETKAVMIVSEQHEDISSAIHDRLGRGTTKLHGKGGFTDKETEVIYTIVTRLEVTKLKSIVYEIDNNAFLTIMSTQETRGGKFKSAIH